MVNTQILKQYTKENEVGCLDNIRNIRWRIYTKNEGSRGGH